MLCSIQWRRVNILVVMACTMPSRVVWMLSTRGHLHQYVVCVVDVDMYALRDAREGK